MSPRLRRLEADYRQLLAAFSGHPNIIVTPVGTLPSERYRIVFNLPGLRLDGSNRICPVYQHVVDLYLPVGYPREKPYATTMQPVFHPNFGAHICLADFWSPAQSLVEVVVQIADMLQYRLYNVHSPLNAVAANWVADNKHQTPISNIDTMPVEPTIRLS
jgi:ubiquitin-protein ligase